MKTKENKTIHELSLQDKSLYPILSPQGRKGQSGERFQNPPKSPLIRETGRSSIFLPPYGGGTFCEAKGGGAFGRGVRAFTLVELIIVITILAILATIAFMSFQGYMKQSRDAVRVSDLASASKGLSIFFTKSGVYPEAESPVTITASGNTLSSQGTLGESVVRAINMNQVPLDPVDQTKYTYSTNGTKTKYQLMTYTENASLASMMTQSYAQDLTDRGIQMQGDGLGIVLKTDNSLPTASVDTYSGTETYKIVFDNDTVLEGSGNLVFSQIYNMRDDLLKNKELAKLDNALVGYWDMETLTGDLLRDWSKYENNGTCYNGTLSGACGKDGFGPQIVNGDGKTGRAMSFDGDDYVTIPHNDSQLIGWSSITFFMKYNLHSTTGSISQVGSNIRLFDKLNYPTGSWIDLDVIYHSDYQLEINEGSNNGSGVGSTISTGGVVLNRDTYLGMVVDRTNKTTSYYYNGILVHRLLYPESFDMPLNITGALHIGSDWNSFKGSMDEFRLYHRALSDAEIKSLYGATK